MIWLLGIYMWLCVHRPFEIYTWLGALQIERAYMAVLIVAWLVSPTKGGLTNRMHFALAAFSLALYGSWLTSPYFGTKDSIRTMDLYWKVLVFYVLFVTSVRTDADLRQAVLLFMAANAAYMVHSLIEWLGGRYQSRMGIARMIGVDITFMDPNAFASTLLYTLPLLVPFWLERKIPRWIILSYVAIASFCIMRTGSRAGMVGLGVWTLLFFVSNSTKKLQTLFLCLLVGSAGGMLLLVLKPDSDILNRVLTLVDPSRGPANAQLSASGRLAGFMEGIRVWSQSPLFGHGPTTFAISTGRGGQAHNLYGQVLSEVGAAGAFGLAILVLCFFLNWREARQLTSAVGPGPSDDFTFQTARALGFACILLLVMGWAGHNLFRYTWQWFAAFQACALHCLRHRQVAQAWDWSPRFAMGA